MGFYSDRTEIITNDQTVNDTERTKRRFLVDDGYPQNLITGYKISNKLLHFNETHKTRDPKQQELIDSKCKVASGSLEKTSFIMVQETLDLDFSQGKFELT